MASAPLEGVQFGEVPSDLFEGVNVGVVLHGEGGPPEGVYPGEVLPFPVGLAG